MDTIDRMPKLRRGLALGAALLSTLAALTAVLWPSGLDAATQAAADAGGEALGFNFARQLVQTGSGTYALVWIDGARLVVGERRFGVAGFAGTATVAQGEGIATPAIIAFGDDLAVAWAEGGSVYARLRVHGRWLPAERVGAGAAPSLAATTGQLGLVWHTPEGETIAFARRSLARTGGGWSRPLVLARASGGEAVSFASVAGQGTRFVAAWKRGGRRSSTIEIARSSSQGARWTAPRSLGEGADPAVCLAGAREVWIGHQTSRGRVVARFSEDGGRTFTRVDVGEGWFAHVACSPGRAVLAWEETPYPPRHPDESAKGFGLGLVAADGTVTPLKGPADAYVASPTVLPHGSSAEAAWIDTSGGRGLRGVLRLATVGLGGG